MEDDTTDTSSTATADDGGLSTARGVSAAGAGMQAGGAIAGGLAAFYAGRTNQAIAGFNARIDQFKAQAARSRGLFEQNAVARQAAQIRARQTTGEAANGVVAGSGTAGSVEASTAGVAAQDAATTRLNALMAAWGYESEAGAEGMRGDLAASAGRQALEASIPTAAGSLGGAFYREEN